MQIHFYTHLIDISPLVEALESIDASEEEKAHLHGIAEDRLHQSIMHAILMELSTEDKKVFLRQVALNDHSQIWRFLHKKTNNIEKAIEKAAEELHRELHEDIKEAKKN